MPNPNNQPTSQPVTARLTTPAQMVASLPLWLGYVPTESLVVACCHEPRGRIGLTLRFDLPHEDLEQELVEEVVRRIAHQRPTRVLVAVYTEEADDRVRARGPLVAELADQLRVDLPGLRITEAVLVRDGRFWSYLCDDRRCCPAEGTPVSAGAGDPEVALLEAEQVLRGQVVLPDREALARSLAGPQLLAAAAARQRCEAAVERHADTCLGGRAAWRERWLLRWAETVELFSLPPAALDAQDAALLATSLQDVLLRDSLAAEHSPERLLPVLAELVRTTPDPFDAPVCTLFAWMTYCAGGGAEVTICLERALRTDPGYSLAKLLGDVMLGQVPPEAVRRITREAVDRPSPPRGRARRFT
jgi:hypothetical protein